MADKSHIVTSPNSFSLQTITDIEIMRERRTTIDRIVSACLYFYTPKELSTNDLMSFNQSSGPVMLDVVGTGGFGEVMIGRLNGEKNPVAVKRALVTQNLTAEQQDLQRERRNIRFEKEARAGLVMSESSYFPRFLGIVLMNGDQCLVTEFIGDKIQGKPYPLFYAIFPDKGCDPEPKMKEWNLVAIGEDIIRGIIDLHDRCLLHNDLKDDNILLEFRQNRWVGVIIDLGMMSTMSYPHFSGSNMSTHERNYFIHTAPEVLNGCEASVASDIFSVGYILDCIGRFIKDDSLRKVGDMCCEGDPKDRPAGLREVLPGVVDIKEKHKTVARLAGELIEDDTDEEQEEGKGVDEDEDFLTEEESQGEEREEGGHQAECEEGDREHQGLEDDVQEEGQIEEGGVESGEEIEEEGIEEENREEERGHHEND
nr:dual specificity testis-specific protein kinase 2-like [Lytechinus pictus]